MKPMKPKNPFGAPGKAVSKAPKNMGGKLPAGIGKPKTDHGKMKMFNKGGKVKGC
jgi:hypothetical protein